MRSIAPKRVLLSRLSGHPFVTPLVFGLAIWMGFPSEGARQDVTSLLTDGQGTKPSWSAVVEKAAAGSIQTAEIPFASDRITTGSISGGGMSVDGVGAVTFRGKGAVQADRPDEDRINRAEKQGRLVRVAPVAPPKAFNAGSVTERTSSLLRPGFESGVKMAFAKAKADTDAVKIAMTFFPKKEKKKADPALPAMVAELVNNEKGDILATAYAPVEPDYARTSPFAMLLKKEDPKGGRFIPPMTQGDHAWLERPLPASAFSDKEQQCLTAGVYFEARGESVKGQAAVAQVILNRVRNPTYPNSICGVVYQNDNWRNACQFSFACDGIRDRVESKSHWEIAKDVALAVTAGKIWLPEVGSSTHYHATYVKPRWARTMQKMKKIGQHIFYRTIGGGWS